ncbi:unnamed protein product [Caretta caretta]
MASPPKCTHPGFIHCRDYPHTTHRVSAFISNTIYPKHEGGPYLDANICRRLHIIPAFTIPDTVMPVKHAVESYRTQLPPRREALHGIVASRTMRLHYIFHCTVKLQTIIMG